MAKTREDPALDHQDARFDLGLVAGLSYSGGQNGEPVVLSKVLVARVELRLVAVGARDGALQVVGHDGSRCAADELQRPHVAAQPVGQRLRPGGFGVGVVRAAEHRDEDLRGARLAAVPINDRYRLPGVVDEELLAGRMVLSQHQLPA